MARLLPNLATALENEIPQKTEAPDVRAKQPASARTKNEGKRGSKTGRTRKGWPRDESDTLGIRVLPETVPTVEVDRVETSEGRRVSIMLSERDWQALQTARTLDGITASERLRTMIAVWRSVTEVGDLVDRIAKPTQASRN